MNVSDWSNNYEVKMKNKYIKNKEDKIVYVKIGSLNNDKCGSYITKSDYDRTIAIGDMWSGKAEIFGEDTTGEIIKLPGDWHYSDQLISF